MAFLAEAGVGSTVFQVQALPLISAQTTVLGKVPFNASCSLYSKALAGLNRETKLYLDFLFRIADKNATHLKWKN